MQILKIRFYQLKRDLGILFFPIVALASLIVYFSCNHPAQVGLYVIAIITYLFHSFHKNRGDLSFAYKHFNSAKTQIVTEYQLFLLPVSIPLLFTGYWYGFFILHLLVLVIPFVDTTRKIQFRFLFVTRYFKSDYIFISGIRKNLFVLVPLISIALALSPLKLFPLVALFIVNAVVFSFYEINESVQMIQASNKTPKQFLSALTSSAAVKLFLVNAPILIVNTVFNFDLFLFNLYFLIYNLLMLATVIVLKYSDYEYKKQGNSIQIKLIIMILGLFIPYLSPLTLIFYLQSRAEAIKNLNNYLDDSH
ncbi:MAG: hypothetical protein V4677_05170 [Bacteroidota bacterium]